MFIRAYLRASTSEQDASRAKSALDMFAIEHGLRIAARYVENESGAKLHRSELFRLLSDCEPGDVLLVEQVDRLSRLTSPDWIKLRNLIDAKQVRIVALDLPTSWILTACCARSGTLPWLRGMMGRNIPNGWSCCCSMACATVRKRRVRQGSYENTYETGSSIALRRDIYL